jgi:type IX secretion system PorP/SprF family membrane protein
MKNIKLVFISICLCTSGFLTAQQDVMFTQYMFNGLTINPAYAGSHNAISANFIGRKQWVKLNGAPQSTSFSIHSPLGGEKIALGAQLIQDKIGVSKNFLGNLSGAYHLPISNTAKLSFGLSAGLDQLSANFNDLYLGQDVSLIDPDLSNQSNFTDSKVNFGTGAYYYSKSTFLGVSVPRLLENSFGKNDIYQQKRHVFVYAGHVFTFSPNFKFKPNVLVKMTKNSPASIDLNANFLLIDKIWLGASYRSFESIDFLAQINVTDQLGIGYAYDWNTNGLKDANSGSHEIMLSYLFSFRKQAMLSPRYF